MKYLFTILFAFFSANSLLAQYTPGEVTLPYESQHAKVMQRIGITDMEVSYCRPAVKGRTIWGDLVPYNNGNPYPWRGGANENTTVTFSTDVLVEGKPLPAGTYGLHIIPSPTEWTFIFSKTSTDWGSFTYDPKEDALRVTAKPVADVHQEYLQYEFVNPHEDNVHLDLHWEKVRCGVQVAVDLKKTVVESMRRELRNNYRFTWAGYNSAAWFCFDNDVNLEEALKWANTSTLIEPRFDNLDTKGQILRRLGKKAEGDSVLAVAYQKATGPELYSHGRDLLSNKKIEEAKEVFEINMKQHPDMWFAHAGMARLYEAEGEMPAALTSMKKARELAPDQIKPAITKVLTDWEKN